MRKSSFLKRIVNKSKRCLDFINDKFLYFCLDYSESERGIKPVLHKCGLNFMLKGRKLICFYGECHIDVYTDLLLKSKSFRKKYLILGGKEIAYLANKHSHFIKRKEAWDKIDVIIYNPGIPDREGAPPLCDVLDWMPKEALRIEVTNAAFKGYMPQHTDRIFLNRGYFIWGDKNLNRLLKEGEIDRNSVQELAKEDFYSEEYVNSYFDKSIKRMKLYEKHCNVKIADYIEVHGREEVLYYSVTHPEFNIMLEITKRIAQMLGINREEILSSNKNASGVLELHSHGEVVYPSVYKGLQIKEDPYERRIQPGNYKISYTFEEYISEYIRMGNLAKQCEK